MSLSFLCLFPEVFQVAVAEQEFIDEDEVLLGRPERRPEIGFGFRGRVLDSPRSAFSRRLADDDIVIVEILQVEADELLTELGVAKALGVLGGELLEVEGANRPLEAGGREDLDAAVLALLVNTVD